MPSLSFHHRFTLTRAAFAVCAPLVVIAACGGRTPAEESTAVVGPAPSGSTAPPGATSGATQQTDVPPEESFTTACQGSLAYTLTDVVPTVPLEFLAIRLENWTLGYEDQPDGPWEASLYQESGTPCQGATDRAGCLARLTNLRRLPTDRAACDAAGPFRQFGHGCSADYWVFTRGDEIGVAVTTEERLALVGGPNNAAEAFLIASYKGYSAACHEADEPRGKARLASDGGYDLIARYAPQCGGDRFKVTLHVDPAGAVTELRRELLPGKLECGVALTKSPEAAER